ncbi:hypothetical protein ACJX0J_031038, partial [Zea mays]
LTIEVNKLAKAVNVDSKMYTEESFGSKALTLNEGTNKGNNKIFKAWATHLKMKETFIPLGSFAIKKTWFLVINYVIVFCIKLYRTLTLSLQDPWA